MKIEGSITSLKMWSHQLALFSPPKLQKVLHNLSGQISSFTMASISALAEINFVKTAPIF